MLNVESLLLILFVALLWTLDSAQIFRDHFEHLEKLTAHELDLRQIVLQVSVSSLNLDVHVLLLDKFKPRPHVAELLEDVGVHLLVLDALAVRPAANYALAESQLARTVKLAGADLLVALEVLVILLQDRMERFRRICLLVPIKATLPVNILQDCLLKIGDRVRRSLIGLLDFLEKLGELVEHASLPLQFVCFQDYVP